MYPKIAEVFSTTACRVERGIRHAIDVAFSKGKIIQLNKIFGVDIFSKNDGFVKVSLHAKSGKTDVCYSVNVKVISDVWQNVKLYKNSFKTKDGVHIKDFSKVYALSMVSEDQEVEFLINNALWV